MGKAAGRGTHAMPPHHARHAKHAKSPKTSSATAPSRAPGARLFPSLTSCSQKPDTTPFRVSPNVTKAAPGFTWCFSITTSAPLSPDSPCGSATTLESIQLWASHDNRSDITSMSIRSEAGNRALYGKLGRCRTFVHATAHGEVPALTGGSSSRAAGGPGGGAPGWGRSMCGQ
ncbi:hypothetical protein PLESTF_001472500 [Pleodorina starrii]|nr:hypothetical protein PLESTF_001472500 [Pleodorina starrii]